MLGENNGNAAPVEAAQVNESTDQVVDESQEAGESQEASSSDPQTADELKDAVKEAIEDGASKKEIQTMLKSFQLKVNGKNITKSIDLSDEKAVQKELQMAAAGQEAMQGRAEYEKALRTLVTRLKEDPLGLAEELGMDADELAAMRLQKKLEQAKKSPEQLKAEELEKKIADYEKKESERVRQIEESEQTRILESAQKQIDEDIDKALEGYKSLPSDSPMVYDLIAKNMVWVMDNFEQFGYEKPEDVKVEDVLPTVEQQLRGSVNQILENIPEEFLDAWIGKKTVDRQRNKRLESAKKVNNINNIPKTSSVKVEKKEERPKIKLSDWARGGF